MIGKVRTINGVKTVVPLSNEVATDSVASGNMESVTSNAVANALSTSIGDLTATNEIIAYCTWGKVVQLHITYTGTITVGGSYNFTTVLPENLRPRILYRGILLNNNIDEPCGQCVINQSGYINMWVSQLESSSIVNLQCSCTFITS